MPFFVKCGLFTSSHHVSVWNASINVGTGTRELLRSRLLERITKMLRFELCDCHLFVGGLLGVICCLYLKLMLPLENI